MAPRWTAADIPDQSGRTFVITGSNSGLGRSAATELAAKGAHVVVAVRDTAKGEAAAAEMAGDVEVRELDLADLDSVQRFADGLDTDVDVLINNAGLMAVPLSRTAQGFETQFGVNHLGHFALTGRLLPRITDRVVALSSIAHNAGVIRFSDLNWERRRYHAWPAYAQSKLANLMFAYEFARRAADAGSDVRGVAAHPGVSATNLVGRSGNWTDPIARRITPLFAQSADMGALPTLYAATVPDLPGGSYIGPGGPFEAMGHPGFVGSNRRSHDADVAGRLWDASEELTGVSYAW